MTNGKCRRRGGPARKGMTPGLCKGRCGGRGGGGAGGILKHEYLMNNNDNNEYAAPMRPEPWKSKARDPTAAARLGKRRHRF